MIQKACGTCRIKSHKMKYEILSIPKTKHKNKREADWGIRESHDMITILSIPFQ
jgi:hypothetical protein